MRFVDDPVLRQWGCVFTEQSREQTVARRDNALIYLRYSLRKRRQAAEKKDWFDWLYYHKEATGYALTALAYRRALRSGQLEIPFP